MDVETNGENEVLTAGYSTTSLLNVDAEPIFSTTVVNLDEHSILLGTSFLALPKFTLESYWDYIKKHQQVISSIPMDELVVTLDFEGWRPAGSFALPSMP